MKFSPPYIVDQIKKNGNDINNCLKELYKALVPMVNKIRRKYGIRDAEARDVVQDVIVDLCEDIIQDKYTETGNMLGYLYTLAENKMINMYKKNLHKEKYIDKNPKTDPEHPNIEKELDADYRKKMVQFFMSKLDTRCNEIVSDFYFRYMSSDDIAEKYQFKNEDVAKNIKSRCFKKLQDIIMNSIVKKELQDLVNI